MTENKYWGYHLKIDALCRSADNFDDKDHAQKFVDELVEKIAMVKFGPLHFYIFGDGDKQGPSAFQLIETSNISWHACNATGAFYLDIFSCRDYEESIALEVFEKYYPTERVQTTFTLRQA
jgi:S-adenosylmethionine decarboxylase